ncbi:MAG: tetratricopeptide repeat protein [Candidatus Omnitrophota bacterium]|nr:tetratricopeptide repeat protein [Candidatus Omnitrophota bacterium]
MKDRTDFRQKLMRSRIIAIFLALIAAGIFCACPVICSERSEGADKETQQAIWEYKHENFEEAYDLLKQLRKERPDSSLVAYYLGITCKQLQDYREAKPNLEAAVTLRPKIKNALPELIDVLYKKGDLKEAKKWIKVAEKQEVHPAQIAFFKGLVLLKEGEDIDGAIGSFEKAKSLDTSLEKTADYYIGLSYVKAEKLKEAKTIFRQIASENPNLSLAGFADQYVDAIERKEEAMRPFRGYFGAALQYDSNVVLQPDSTTLAAAIGDKGDWRHAYTFYGEHNLRPVDYFNLKTAYSFYCGKQFDLGFYDMLSHNILAQPSFYMEKAAINFPVNFNYVTINDKHYLNTVSVGNLDNVKIGRNHMAELAFIYKYDDFIWETTMAGENRDSNELIWYAGWFWFFSKNKGFAHLRYTMNYDDTRGDNWRYFGNRITLNGILPIIEDRVKWGGTLDYFIQRFARTNLIFDQKRRDNVLTVSSFLTIEIVKNLELRLDYTFVDDGSNIRIYGYTRNVYSMGMKYRF